MFKKLFGWSKKQEEIKTTIVKPRPQTLNRKATPSVNISVSQTKTRVQDTLSNSKQKNDGWIEMPVSLLIKHWLPLKSAQDSELKDEGNADKRSHVRMKTESIVIDENEIINVECRDLSNGRICNDVLLNISCWGLLLLSSNSGDRTIGSKLELQFKIAKKTICARWVIVSQTETSNRTKMKYGIKFINLKKEDSLHISLISGSIYLGKDVYNKR